MSVDGKKIKASTFSGKIVGNLYPGYLPDIILPIE
tara:strand:+ start:2538 stop:2642 length:105 start_codon:yes stop_codon:yes gene_type:complete